MREQHFDLFPPAAGDLKFRCRGESRATSRESSSTLRGSIASLLASKRDKAAANDGAQASLFDRANVRGPDYYH
jgi:hypothetical protein